METSPQDYNNTVAIADYSRFVMGLILFLAFGIIGAWLILTPAGVTGKADAVGYAICHRIEQRSFAAFGRQLSLCARCSGIYLGAMTTLAIMVASGRARVSFIPNWKVLTGLGLTVMAIGIDGGNSYFHLFPDFEGGLYDPSNTYRLITGMFFGMTFMAILLPMFNATVWKRLDKRAPLNNLTELAGMCLVIILMILAVLTEQSLILLAAGLISAFGVLLMLTIIYTVMIITFMQRDRTYNHWTELWLPGIGGLTIAITMIGIIDFLRYSFTGTWDGFFIPAAMKWLTMIL